MKTIPGLSGMNNDQRCSSGCQFYVNPCRHSGISSRVIKGILFLKEILVL